ncbi:hypothetical protein APR03_001982 [Promicromonospora thailandica]|uniref:Uncharacterized protein n=2 Tax=Promicromonospora thailandica TaxID=765201 RepID=A0A9X2G0L8_9MICO|nr:hypothetical protein [Promicromonospora thailandica]
MGYVALEAWLGSLVSLWSWSLLKETIVWFFVTGFVLLLNISKVTKERHYIRNRIGAVVGISVFLEFLTNLFVLPLVAELLLQPFVAVVAVVGVVAARKAEHRQAKRLTEGILAIIGIGLLAYNIQQIIVGWNELDGRAILLELALPIWMTVGLLPFLYALSLYSNYELAFGWIEFDNKGTRRSRVRAKIVLIVRLNIRGKTVHHFDIYWGKQIAETPSFKAAWNVVSRFHQAQKDRKERREAKEQAAADEQERLKRYAGVDGTDDRGRRLDRREFKETTATLQRLSMWQRGWYINQGGRYRKRVLAFLDGEQDRHGLPASHGITMKIREDGQAWYAWRRTVSGWCFAIGAAGPPPDQWEYDGAEPPSGFPGEDPAWGDGALSYRETSNW